MKSGLNVAAIGCRGIEETTRVSAYNKIIKTHGKVIRSTEKSVIKELGKENKNNGIAPRDRLSTRLFNYFAQPPAQSAFCPRANEIAQIVSTQPTDQLVEQASAHLTRRDQTIPQCYTAYTHYQTTYKHRA